MAAAPAAGDGGPPAAPAPQHPRRHVVVLVLGDLGRSPRMQYHALSFAKQPGMVVSLVGLAGERCFGAVEAAANVRRYHLRPSEPPAALPYAARALLKVLLLSVRLLQALLFHLPWPEPPHLVLVQTPPALPTLPIAWLACALRRAALAVDWHNLGHTVLAQARNLDATASPLCLAYRRVEQSFAARGAQCHFCVSAAFAAHLRAEFGCSPAPLVLRDMPPAHFQPATRNEAAETFERLTAEGGPLASARALFGAPGTSRPAVLVSPTSWSADEDFSVLLDAMVEVDGWLASVAARAAGAPPAVLVVVTGKGPEKGRYLRRIAGLALEGVRFVTPWLEPGDYPKVVAAADLGVCLHQSTSGLDLPMKAVDMLGCGVPIAALDYPALPELVRRGENGVVFRDAGELAGELKRLLVAFGTEASPLAKLREGAAPAMRWDRHWDAVAAPALARLADEAAERRSTFSAAAALLPLAAAAALVCLVGLLLGLLKLGSPAAAPAAAGSGPPGGGGGA